MDKFVIVGGFLCFAADVFAIASLATPEWVVMEFAGKFVRVINYWLEELSSLRPVYVM